MTPDLTQWLPWVNYGCAVLAVVAGLRVVTGRQLFHSALALGLSLLSVAGLYFVVAADFLAVAQILIYVGAILTLIAFAIMLTTGFGDPTIPQANRQRLPAALITLAVWILLVRVTVAIPWDQLAAPQPRVPVATVGRTLVTSYLLPFELISILFVACLIGAIAISAQRRPMS